ncbi:magnesium transporter CorA family protein [Lacticaseibacillus baoqingensis]|uniref:Magnesium transporter CorA family protein n=1 Tax=Lacticaseibacillus baoqingensis TaxID=2486013 RepID=A0ABW4E5G3_9LACO|nr:magnesium transporter CorA family protein [Lacticaseibacillus baoqingensis]
MQIKDFEWVHLDDPTPATLDAIGEQYDLPQRFLTAALDEFEEPRIDQLDAPVALMNVRVPHAFESETGVATYETVPLTLLFCDQALVTVAKLGQVDLTQVQAQLAAASNAKTASFVIVAWALAAYDQVIADLSQRVQTMEGRVAEASQNRLLYEVMALEKALVHLTSALAAMHTMLKQASRSEFGQAHAITMHELTVQAHQALSVAQKTEEILDQYNTAISSVIGNNLNLIMKFLTGVSIILAIPPIFSGIWGQNTWIPWRQPVYGFWVVLGLTLLVSLATAWWLKKKKYM